MLALLWMTIDWALWDSLRDDEGLLDAVRTDLNVQLHVAMRLTGSEEAHFDASLALRLRALDRRAVRRGALAFPAQSIATLVRIYREAFALWRKGAPFYVHPDKRGDHGHARTAD